MKTILLCLFALIGLSSEAQTMIVRGQVLDSENKPVQGAIIRSNRSRNTATSDKNGMYTITTTHKDKELRMSMHGNIIMTMPVSKADVIFAMDASNDPSVRGYMKGDTYYPGSADVDWKNVITERFIGVVFDEGAGTVMINRFAVNTPSTSEEPICKYYELDGSTIPNLNVVEISTVHSIRIIKDLAESIIYGGQGQFGAVIVTSKGLEKKE